MRASGDFVQSEAREVARWHTANTLGNQRPEENNRTPGLGRGRIWNMRVDRQYKGQ